MALLSRFFGRTASEGAAYAFGIATGPVLSPATEAIRQEAWSFYQSRIPPVGALAEGVAQGQVDRDQATEWAKRQGYGNETFGALVDVASVGPGAAAAFDLWRRGFLDEAGFRRAVKRLGLEQEWITALVKLKLSVLDPADLARGIHRGLVPDPGLLRGELPRREGNIPAYPVYDIDALAEAMAHGIDKDHLGVLVGLQGNPMGAHEAASAMFRGILTRDDFLRAIAEGNTRNEWADAILEQTRQIPTARDFLENALRGYRDLRSALEGAALHGMTEEHATMIYQNQGRPMPVRRITQALARGGKFKPEPGEIKDPYRASIVEGSLKPAYYELEEAMKYTPPSVFAIRQLAQTGTWNQAKVAERLKWLGWIPEDADEVARAWTQTTASGPDSHLSKAQNQLWTTVHRSFINREISNTVARNALGQAGVPANIATQVIGIWDAERELVRKQLTPAQIKKALAKGSRNAATGQPWTRDEAIAALVDLGYAPLVANDFLDIP